MLIYNYSPKNNVYLGSCEADVSPLEPDVYLIPASSTTIAVPDFDEETQECVWNGASWDVREKGYAERIIEEQKKADEEEPPNTPRDIWEELRFWRRAYLQQTDWTQFNDSPLTDEERQNWATYRQQLRDLPGNLDQNITEEEYDNLVWPTVPYSNVVKTKEIMYSDSNVSRE